jgi:hypothetical protein
MSESTSKWRTFWNRSSTPGHIPNKAKFFLAFPQVPVALSNTLILNSIVYWLALKPLKDRAEMYKDDVASEEGAFARQLGEHPRDAFVSRAFFTYIVYQFFRGPTAIYFTAFLFMMDYVLLLNGVQATIVDDDEQRTGARKAGLFTGLNALLTIPIGGLHTVIFTSILSAYTFVSGSQVQSARAVQGIRIGASVIPFASILLSTVPMWLSPINLRREQALSAFSEQMNQMKESLVEAPAHE